MKRTSGEAASEGGDAPAGSAAAAKHRAKVESAGRSRSEGEGSEPRAMQAPASPSSATRYRVRQLRRSFPQARATENPSSAGAIAKGEEACRGKTPVQVKQEFLADSKLDVEQRQFLAELPRYEAQASRDPSFSSGQIAATVYEKTLSKEEQRYGFQGCVHALAVTLERELAGG